MSKYFFFLALLSIYLMKYCDFKVISKRRYISSESVQEQIHSKITMTGDTVPYCTVTALHKSNCAALVRLCWSTCMSTLKVALELLQRSSTVFTGAVAVQ